MKVSNLRNVALGLTLNEAKTSIRDARKERFEFLGYSFLAFFRSAPLGRPRL
jgi:hypothetical protein